MSLFETVRLYVDTMTPADHLGIAILLLLVIVAISQMRKFPKS